MRGRAARSALACLQLWQVGHPHQRRNLYYLQALHTDFFLKQKFYGSTRYGLRKVKSEWHTRNRCRDL